VEAYNGINAYLSELSGTSMKRFEDVIAYNDRNKGTEGAYPGDHPAFPRGQVGLFFDAKNLLINAFQDNLREIADTRGHKDVNYLRALKYMRTKSRAEGIDAALKQLTSDGKITDFDALLLCDRKGCGQQLAAQAGDTFRKQNRPSILIANGKRLGYPIICIPIGVDSAGIPFSLSIQHSAWREEALIKWASAIENVVHDLDGPRPTPTYKNHMSKNIPIERKAVG